MGTNKNDANTYIIELVDVYYKIKNGKIKAKAKIKDDDGLERLMKEFFGEKQKWKRILFVLIFMVFIKNFLIL